MPRNTQDPAAFCRALTYGACIDVYYDLPTSVSLGGEEVPIRSDFRAVLDIFAALNDPALTDEERGEAVLGIFYPALPPGADPREALEACFRFIRMGQAEPARRTPRLVDWEKDFPLIAAPVNRVLGYEIRAVPYDPYRGTGGVHWYTFLSAYYEIGGDCTFAQVVAIRDKLARHLPLDKQERDWYRRSRDLVDMPRPVTSAEEELIKEWT